MVRDSTTEESDGGAAPTAARAAAVAIERLAQLTSKDLQSVTRVEPIEDGWLVEVEVLEDHRIPSSADIMALYEVELDLEENLLAYSRIKRYTRGSVDIEARGRR